MVDLEICLLFDDVSEFNSTILLSIAFQVLEPSTPSTLKSNLDCILLMVLELPIFAPIADHVCFPAMPSASKFNLFWTVLISSFLPLNSITYLFSTSKTK